MEVFKNIRKDREHTFSSENVRIRITGDTFRCKRQQNYTKDFNNQTNYLVILFPICDECFLVTTQDQNLFLFLGDMIYKLLFACCCYAIKG